jgi:hypothetical protein
MTLCYLAFLSVSDIVVGHRPSRPCFSLSALLWAIVPLATHYLL